MLSFTVGAVEQHQVGISFDRMRGGLEIRVDGSLVETDRHWLSFTLTRQYEFTVGQQERHAVGIIKKRKLFLAGFRPSRYQVFVDGQLAFTREV